MQHFSNAARVARATPALVAFALLAIAAAPAHADADPGDTKKQAGRADAALGADQAPDRTRKADVSPAATRALKAIQGRIAKYVDDHGKRYSFASYLDSDTGRIVLDTDAPASVVSGLTSMSDPEQRRSSAGVARCSSIRAS